MTTKTTAPALPVQTHEQLIEYSRQATLARTRRAEFLAAIKAREIVPSDALRQASTDEVLSRIPVRSLIGAVPHVGERTTERIMDHVQIAHSRRVRGLGKRQYAALSAILDQQAVRRERL